MTREELKLFRYLLRRIEDMSQEIDALKSAVATGTTTQAQAIATLQALKQKYDAAIANATSLTATVSQLTAELAAAQAAAASPADTQAIVDATTTVVHDNQALADAVAVNAPAN